MKTWISELWCKKMHSQPMWPIHGKYICPQCLREYRVAWEGPASPEEYAPSLRRTNPSAAAPAFTGAISHTPVSTTL
jgi:hypothetical protein